MDYIWAPWRMPYIKEEQAEDSECIFCQLLDDQDGPGNLILHRAAHSFAVLNRYPYTNGHLMVVPYDHRPDLQELPPETLTEMMLLTRRATRLLRSVYKAHAFNIGINIGTSAGAGIADHVHIHVVPRWAGDTNFMATTARARVLPEALEVTYEKLHTSWDRVEDQ